jgi:hypothetical protein
MAFSNKSELKAAITDFMAREDLDGKADDWIALAESRLNRKLVPVRERETDGAPFALSDDGDTNWLLTNHPDLYLAASIVWGGAYTKSTDEVTGWNGLLSEGVEELLWENAREESRETLSVDMALLPCGVGFDIVSGE